MLVLLIVLLYALLALTFTLGKAALSYANPLFLVGVRMVAAGILLLGIYRFKQPFPRFSRQDVTDLLNVTLFHIYLSFVPEFWALQFVSSVKVNIMYATTPFITILFSYLLYNEKITRMQALGSVIAFSGLLPLMARQGDGAFCLADLFAFSVPELTLLVSITSAAYAWFVVKKLMNRGYSLLIINGISMLLGGIGSFITWYILSPAGVAPVTDLKPFIITVVALILLANVVVYNLYGWLLRRYSLNVVSCAGFMSPLFGALYGHLLLNEQLGWQHYIAMASITIGLYMFFYETLVSKKSSVPVPPPETA